MSTLLSMQEITGLARKVVRDMGLDYEVFDAEPDRHRPEHAMVDMHDRQGKPGQRVAWISIDQRWSPSEAEAKLKGYLGSR